MLPTFILAKISNIYGDVGRYKNYYQIGKNITAMLMYILFTPASIVQQNLFKLP